MGMTKEAFIDYVYEAHQKAFSEWTEGEIFKHWYDDNNILCIKYESGRWWHYKQTEHGLEWW